MDSNSFNWLDYIDLFHHIKPTSYNFGSYFFGSFSFDSFVLGSFTHGSYDYSSYSFGSYHFDSYSLDHLGSFGSFPYECFGNLPESIKKEPLNIYGYGIDLI